MKAKIRSVSSYERTLEDDHGDVVGKEQVFNLDVEILEGPSKGQIEVYEVDGPTGTQLMFWQAEGIDVDVDLSKKGLFRGVKPARA